MGAHAVSRHVSEHLQQGDVPSTAVVNAHFRLPMHTPAQIMGQVMYGNRPSVPEPSAYGELPGPGPFPGLPAWVELMQRCWHQDPAHRPDFVAIIAQLRWGGVQSAASESAAEYSL